MWTIRSSFAIALIASAAGAASAQSPARVGAELQINTYTANHQALAVVAPRGNGDFVVAWSSSDGQDGAVSGIFARRVSASGVLLGAELQVNVRTSEGQYKPAIAADADGDFVVVWQSDNQDGSVSGIFARRFNASGVPQGAELQVNAYTMFGQNTPAVAAADDGRFVVAWESVHDGDQYGIFARRFNALGAPQATEFRVNSYTTGLQLDPTVSLDSDGDFVIAWSGYGQDGFPAGASAVFARRFDSAGGSRGVEFQVNNYTPGYQYKPFVALDADGDFVVAWTSGQQDGGSYGVFARRFASSGAALAVEFQVPTRTLMEQQRPSVAVEANGAFVIAWQSIDQDGSDGGIFARRFDSAGTALAVELQVNTYTTSEQTRASATIDDNHRLVVVWESQAQDGNGLGVFAQRFVTPVLLDIDGGGSTDALTDGLLVLRYHFGFTGATLITGAVGPGCTRCTAPEILAYLQSMD